MIECDRMNMMMMTMRNGSCCCLCCVIVLDDDDDDDHGNDGTRVTLSRVVDGVGVDDALVVGNNLYIIGDDVCMSKEMCELLLFCFWFLDLFDCGTCETLFQIFIDPRCCAA